MPTVLLLDVSLSMSRSVGGDGEPQTRQSLASAALICLLDYLSLHAKLEYVALMTFASSCQVECGFTRDYDLIRVKLRQCMEEMDRTSFESALLAANHLILTEWGHQTPAQIIIVTDGSCGVGPLGRNRIISALPLPPPYPVKIHILPMAAPHEASLPHAMPLYQKIVDLASSSNMATGGMSRGAIYCPDQLSTAGVVAATTRLCEQQYAEFVCTLRCGQLESRVQLFPPPLPAQMEGESAWIHIAPVIHVIGFISAQDLGTPITINKHLIIPQPQTELSSEQQEAYSTKTSSKDGSSTESSVTEEDTTLDPSNVPNFCVLLHGALKVEGMTALVQLREGWWGVVSAWCEAVRARRSTLLLCALQPGTAAAPWLGPLDRLGPADEPGESFPVRSVRSYAAGGAGGAAWARPHALLADVQKVLRHARKLPDKTQQFYKELNRLRRAAISLGFVELLSCIGGALERECAALPAGSAPECALQLAHAAASLRDPRTNLDVKHTIQPLSTSFTMS